ncbi:hypothetical protein KAW50_07350 [candidate division WOR-3 bacterium]|nr:hypothetical protein [candidate division WOR-3 bacterium]
MTKQQIDREYKKLNYEIFVNRPAIAPYPPEVVKRRELLLFAQVHLGNILGAKMEKDKVEEALQEFYYWVTIREYYNWGENGRKNL